MKIALVSEHASPLAALGGEDAGGQNVHVASLAIELGRLGHSVTVYTRRDSRKLSDEVPFATNVTVVHVPAGPPKKIPKDGILPHVPAFGNWLRARWRFDPPDVIHSHFWMSGLAALRGAAGRIPVVHTYHALGTVKRRHQGKNDTSPRERLSAEAAIGRDAAAIIATCADEVDELIRMKVPRTKSRVVPCGVDTDLFHPDKRAKLKPKRPRLLSLGRIVPRKGVDTIVEALRFIPDAELVVAGGPAPGGLHRDPEITRLRWEASQAGVADRVRFTGQISREDVPALIRSSTAVVCVPWYEPFGMVTLEAMACGAAVVASYVGGQKETIVNGVTGLLVPPRRPIAVAQAVQQLLRDPVRRTAYGIAGADRARSRYTWPRIATETLAVYEGVVTRHLERTAS
ncbi:glycosyltransferase [Streptosporangiaceae bacterium NEAU-GS5]|nr:glycosyltransferase [Streptosporangiaceae bacterium NEAU-GS5]